MGPEEASLDKRRRILGADKMDRQQGGRVRTPFSVVTNNAATSDAAEGAAVVVDFTKDEVETLLNEKKGNTYDNKVFEMFFT